VRRLELLPGGTGWGPLRKQFKFQLVALMSVAGIALFAACANVANLLLARATARRRGMAVRLALGSGRFGMLVQLLTGSSLLVGFGGLLAIFIGYAGVRFLLTYLPHEGGTYLNATIDLRTLAFTGLVSVLSAFITGLVPAIHATTPNITSGLNEQHGN